MLIKSTVQKAPTTLLLFLTAWLVTEVALLIAPSLLPDTWYLKGYLSDTAEEKTLEFLNNKNATIPDEDLGWVNKKNLSLGSWVIDQWGGRHHKPIALDKPENTYRTVILGSSLMNGNNAVDNNGTISAILDENLNKEAHELLPQFAIHNHEVLNFATMMYGMDQILVQIKKSIINFRPDMLVIGLHEEPIDSLNNVYIPFRLPEEENMPYVKPQFEIQENQLVFHKAPLKLLNPMSQDTVDYFKKQDHFFYNFERFQHFGFMPLGDELSKIYLKAQNMQSYWSPQESEYQLLRTLMADLQAYADKKGIKIVYLYLPTPRGLDRGGIWKFMPDYYAQRLQWLQKPWSQAELAHLESTPDTRKPMVLDIRNYFKTSNISTDKLYAEDYFHFSKQGNKTIADAIEDLVFKSN
ncbi:MAG: hypothetical protein VX185_02340 [Pseudomonadota bacterium]|nr:hypothetical protein [Pseudomonadota bacterium]